jgi:hypothetical protein
VSFVESEKPFKAIKYITKESIESYKKRVEETGNQLEIESEADSFIESVEDPCDVIGILVSQNSPMSIRKAVPINVEGLIELEKAYNSISTTHAGP